MTRAYGPYFEGRPVDRTPNPRSFPAKYAGWCKLCRKRIERGAMMTRAPDDSGWAHEHCANAVPREPEPEPGSGAVGGSTYLTFDGEWFVWRSPPDQKDPVKAAGFMWRGFARPGQDKWPYAGEKVWITKKIERAHLVREYADAKALKALSEYAADIAESDAADADIVCPAPKGVDYFPFQKAGIRALLKRPKALLASEMGLGKEQPVDARVLTPLGWVKIGSLEPGDQVIGSDGQPTEVKGVFPQGVKPTYRVTFSDGSSVEAGGEHLWTVRYRKRGRELDAEMVLTTDQLRERPKLPPVKHANGLVTQKDLSKTVFYLPMLSAPVAFASKDLPLPAYLVGQMIANGYMTGTTPTVSCNALDWEEIRDRLETAGVNITGVHQYDNVIRAHFPGTIATCWALEMTVPSREKRIPQLYMYAGIEDRIALFHGLMDGDGSISRTRCRVTYSTLSPNLAADVQELVEGLGGIASVREYDRTHHNKPVEYSVRIRVPSWVTPFSTTRKLSRYQPGSHAHPMRTVKSVEYSRDVESVCISVAASDELYVTEHCILTHNTVQFLGLANCLPDARKVLVIVPAHLVLNWKDEAEKWLVEDWKIWLPKNKKDTPPSAERLFVVVNYDKLSGKVPPPLFNALIDIDWDIVGADESHYVKNKKSQRTWRVMGQNKKVRDEWVNTPGLMDKAKRIVFMTGTPIPNRVIEIHGMLAKIHKQFRSFKYFALRYAGGSLEYPYPGARQRVWKYGEPEHLDELQEKMRACCMIRHLKKDVLTELPPKTRQIMTIQEDDMTADTKRAMKAEQKAWNKLVAEFGEDEAYRRFVEELMKPDKGPAFEEISRVRSKVAKLKAPYVAKHVEDMLYEGISKILVFTHHHDVTDTIVEKLTTGKDPALKRSEIDVYDGRIPDKVKRRAIEKRFQTDPTLKVLVISIIAGGTGITLTASSNVVFAEFPWRPSDVTQAEDRTHRIGQKKNVLVQHLVLEDTLDARMVETIVRKQAVADAALDQSTGESVADLQETVGEREQETVRKREKAAEELEKWKATREERIASGKVSRAMSSRDIEEMAERAELTKEQIDLVGETISELAWMDPDKAKVKNDMGFNKADVALGHALAHLYRSGTMTSREAFLGAYIGFKYHRQIGEETADAMLKIVGMKPKGRAKPEPGPTSGYQISLPKSAGQKLAANIKRAGAGWIRPAGKGRFRIDIDAPRQGLMDLRKALSGMRGSAGRYHSERLIVQAIRAQSKNQAVREKALAWLAENPDSADLPPWSQEEERTEPGKPTPAEQGAIGGKEAFDTGAPSAPAANKTAMAYMKTLPSKGDAFIEYMAAFNEAWHKAHKKATDAEVRDIMHPDKFKRFKLGANQRSFVEVELLDRYDDDEGRETYDFVKSLYNSKGALIVPRDKAVAKRLNDLVTLEANTLDSWVEGEHWRDDEHKAELLSMRRAAYALAERVGDFWTQLEKTADAEPEPDLEAELLGMIESDLEAELLTMIEADLEPEPKRRGAVVIIEAGTGSINAARRAMGDAIRSVLGVKRWHTEPHFVTYETREERRSEGDSFGDPRYLFDVTDDELTAVMKQAEKNAKEAGLAGRPFDVYHD